jgi:nitrite reductase (NADH) large subunit
MPKQRLVIVGNGMAAARVVEELVERGGSELFQIAVFGEEPCPSYDRLHLADVMNGTRSVEQILHLAPAWFEERRIRVYWGERAVLVSRQARTVYGSAGTEERYDVLVFATGSSPHFPPIKNLFNAAGIRLPGVCDFRTLADCVQIVALSNGARAVAIIGGGLLALEAARGLARHDRRVELIHRGVVALTGDERVTGVLLDDGSQLTCDLLVIATGLIPNTWLAYQCGLSVERGIAVDGHLRSIDDRRVYALGECAQPWGKLFCEPEAIRQQAKLLVAQLIGSEPGAASAVTTTRERQAGGQTQAS